MVSEILISYRGEKELSFDVVLLHPKDFEHSDFLFCSKSPGEEKDEAHISSAPEIRDVFGDSEDEEEADYVVQDQIDEEQNVCISAK